VSEAGIHVLPCIKGHQNAALGGAEHSPHPGANDYFPFRAMHASPARHCGRQRFSGWTSYLDVRNRETFGNPKHGRAEITVQDTHHKVNVRMPPSHIADETPPAVALLIKAERRVSVTTPMILDSPAFCFAIPDSQAERPRHVQDRNVPLNPRDVRAG
jgi:hypothetical protein